MAFAGSASGNLLQVGREPGALRDPIARSESGRAASRFLRARSASKPPQRRDQRFQRLLDVGVERDLRRVILAELPVALGDLEYRHAIWKRIDRAVDRHAQHVAAQEQRDIVRFKQLAHFGLLPRDAAHEAWVLRKKLRRMRHGLLVNRSAEELRQFAGKRQGIVELELMTGDQHRIARFEQPFRERLDDVVGRPRARVDTRWLTKVEVGFVVEHVSRQAQKNGAGRWGSRNLRSAADDARQVLYACDLDCPLHEGLRNRNQRMVKQRLGQSVALFLLSGGDHDRRAYELRAVERAHRVTQARRHMHVASSNLAGSTSIAVRHRHDYGFLKAKDVVDLALPAQRLHDRELGGARVTEEVLDAFRGEQAQECVTSVDLAHVLRRANG
jgi:hypothetical protein